MYLPELAEHRFWLPVLSDHAQFIYNHLAPNETAYVQTASQFIAQLDEFVAELNGFPNTLPDHSPQLVQFANRIYPVIDAYCKFEGHLQNLRIQNKVELSLSPTYLVGTIAENEEYIRLLSYYANGQSAPPLKLTDLLELWLLDQSGHGMLLVNILDPIEMKIIKQVHGYVNVFLIDMATNAMLRHYLKFTSPGFPFERKAVRTVARNVIRFYRFVEEAVSMYQQSMMMNKTTIRFLEHHFPESRYFLYKLAEYDPGITQLEGSPIR